MVAVLEVFRDLVTRKGGRSLTVDVVMKGRERARLFVLFLQDAVTGGACGLVISRRE